ncbi:hypothetical protein CCHR01_02965 [Colletotrichum chrysophilum]|uniref:Uncharacterized protein n=1 Tax=Colletotrichum chrysophilum TaxID=1836956 RepID=A0AAD9AZA3_9PEZI|nr:hypothetical protein CCHR01_02965 [Colletotrichum chrysophilum]
MSLPFPGLFSRTGLLVKPHAPQISLTPKPHFARGQAGLLLMLGCQASCSMAMRSSQPSRLSLGQWSHSPKIEK